VDISLYAWDTLRRRHEDLTKTVDAIAAFLRQHEAKVGNMFVTVGRKLDEIEGKVVRLTEEVSTMAGETRQELDALGAALADIRGAIADVARETGQVATRIEELLAQIAEDPGNAAKVRELIAEAQTQTEALKGEVAKLDAVSGVPDLPVPEA